MREGKGLAIAALALGVVGLFTAGGLGIGSLVGLVLAGAALIRRSAAGRDVAWAALAANVVALLTIVPVGLGLWAYSRTPGAFGSDEDTLPEPVRRPAEIAFAGAPPPPPPPPPRVEAARRESGRGSSTAGSRAESPVRAGGGIPEPKRVRGASPVYPEAARAARLQGTVVLECTISAEGKVVAIRKLRGAPLLDAAAIDAVRGWEYTPTLLNGVPVPVIVTVTVSFKLS